VLRRMTIIFGVCGFLIALLLGVVWNYLIGHTSINPHSAPILSDATDWLWPSNLMLMTYHNEGRWGNALGTFLSAVANGFIYSVAGLIVGKVLKLFVVHQEKP
jgi:hypothetical protein